MSFLTDLRDNYHLEHFSWSKVKGKKAWIGRLRDDRKFQVHIAEKRDGYEIRTTYSESEVDDGYKHVYDYEGGPHTVKRFTAKSINPPIRDMFKDASYMLKQYRFGWTLVR